MLDEKILKSFKYKSNETTKNQWMAGEEKLLSDREENEAYCLGKIDSE